MESSASSSGAPATCASRRILARLPSDALLDFIRAQPPPKSVKDLHALMCTFADEDTGLKAERLRGLAAVEFARTPEFWDDVFPVVLDLALRIRALFPAGLPLLMEDGVVELTAEQAASIVASMFLGTLESQSARASGWSAEEVAAWEAADSFALPNKATQIGFPDATMLWLLLSNHGSEVAKIAMVLEYFRQVAGFSADERQRRILVRRVTLPRARWPRWRASEKPLQAVRCHTTGTSVRSHRD